MPRHETHQNHEALKVASELRHHDFVDARKELAKEAHHPRGFKTLVEKLKHDLKTEHQHPLSVEHDRHGNITHLHFDKHDIYDRHHSSAKARHKNSPAAHHGAEQTRHHGNETKRSEHPPKDSGATVSPKDNYSGYFDSSNAPRGTDTKSSPQVPPAPDISPETIAAIRKMNLGSGAPTPRAFYTRPGEER